MLANLINEYLFSLQVDLATRLSDTSTQLAESQLEVTSLKNRESELRQQLDKLVTMDTQSRDELSSLRLQITGQSTEIHSYHHFIFTHKNKSDYLDAAQSFE